VLTAAHCVFDESAGAFATNWIYIPNYDAAPAPLSTSNQSYCEVTKYGCWQATALVAHRGFTEAGSFNTQATVHDFAVAVVKSGGKSSTALAETLGAQSISTQPFNSTIDATGQQAYAFGYPAAGKYKGRDLVYCAGTLGRDLLNTNLTYRMGCNMTGGSSGGPWFASFNTSSGVGTQVSVNSYGYSGITAMFGPVFNTKTQAVYDAALTASGNTTVSS
jgi:hypothetical protein